MSKYRSQPGRPVALLVTGPLSLFRTTGIYYLRELTRTYDVVLVGWKDYAGDKSFSVATGWPGVREVRLLAPAWEPRAYHREAAALGRDVADRIHPRVVLQHNDCYPHNLYLIRAARRCGVFCATYANGLTLDPEQEQELLGAAQVVEIAERWHLPLPAARRYFNARSVARHWQRFALLPLLTGSAPLRGYQDLDTMRIYRRHTAAINDLHLIYSERERFCYQKSLEPGAVEIIRHPVEQVGAEVHDALGMPSQKPQIAFLPTWGPLDILIKRTGDPEGAVARTAAVWTETLSRLQRRLGGIPVCVKLHPAAARDERMATVVARLRAAIPDLVIVDPSESAERVILGSTVVVGDVSSVQWWARAVGGVIVVSVDAWDLPGGDEFRHYPGVVYVKDPREIDSAALEPPDRAANTAPTLTQVFGAFALL